MADAIPRRYFSQRQRKMSNLRFFFADEAFREYSKKEYQALETVIKKARTIDRLATQDANNYIKTLCGNK